MERVEKHIKRLQDNAPEKGNIRVLEITDKQYERMLILRGDRRIEEENGDESSIFL
jgi:CRISPR-associated protein Cas2